MNINISTKIGWKFVHNGHSVLTNPFQTFDNSETLSIYNIYECDSYLLCMVEIQRLGLTYSNL